MTAKKKIRTMDYHLCTIDSKGRVVKIDTRKSVKAIENLQSRTVNGFVVGRYVAIDENASDYGTIYFFDLNGQSVEVHNV